MSITTYNVPPYYDDFDPEKNYLRVLFRPGYAVQARELTQLQTAIQSQIERFGNHVFQNGSQVMGGQASLDTSYAYIKLETSFNYTAADLVGPTTNYPQGNTGTGATEYLTASVGETLKLITDTGIGSPTGITATILEFLPSTTSDYLTAYVKYTAANETAHVFSAGAILNTVETPVYIPANGTTPAVYAHRFKVVAASATGYGTRVAVNDGVYYINGNFVYTPASSIIVSKYSSYPSARVVYKISENIVTSAEDPSLVDNALGTPNDSAPGAHRYQIALDLAVESLDLPKRVEDDIINVLSIRNGAIIGKARTEYSELANTLATRTYEESGNYTVRAFQLNVREYYNDGTNGGLYTALQIVSKDGVAAAQAITYGGNRLAVGLEPAVAYVNGYRIETLDTTYVPVLKARDIAISNSAVLSCELGGYVYIDTLVGIPNITTYSVITLKKADAVSIGTARARGLQYVSGTRYKLYLFDINIPATSYNYTFADVRTLVDSNLPVPFSAAISDISTGISDAVLYNTSTSSLLYKLPSTATKTLRDLNNSVDLVYNVRRKFDSITASSGIVQLDTGSSNKVFTSNNAADFICVNNTSNGAVATPMTITSAGLQTISLTFAGSASNSFTIIAPVTHSNISEKSKTLTVNSQITLSTPNTTLGNYDVLGKTDVLRIKGIYMSANRNTVPDIANDPDISGRYELDNGQRENFYDLARIRLKPGSSAPTGQITVVFDYFAHGAGDYFSVNSYDSTLYSLIPSFDSIKGKIELRDALDFRPTKDTTGTAFTGTGGNTSHTIVPGSLIITDIQYYLPRTDKIYVNKTGTFGVQYGISDAKPAAPSNPTDSMVLYALSLGAYTFGKSDLTATAVDNRRYTMRDIGRLEQRIANVEYYTSLSLLEKETASKQIMDGTNQRYKNGFVVDSFVGHGIGAISHPDYHCSVDIDKGILRPEFYQDNTALVVNLTDSGTSRVRKTGPLITLDYTEVPAITQPYASGSEIVNPHAIWGWRGEIRLSPPGDDWKETQIAPALAANADPQLSWFSDISENSSNKVIYNAWTGNWYGSPPVSGTTAGGTELQVNSISSLTAQQSGSSTLSGTAYLNSGTYNFTTTQTYSDLIVSTSLVSYIRSRKVYFSVSGLKPNSRLYAFFDGIQIADYINSTDTFVDYTTAADNTNYLDYTVHPSPSGASTLTTDASGNIAGSFIIPNNSTLKFLTGSRVFRLIDNVTNNINAAYTYADITYTASGILETHQTSVANNTVVSTVPAIVRPVAQIVQPQYSRPAEPSVLMYTPGAELNYSGFLAQRARGPATGYLGSPIDLKIGLNDGMQYSYNEADKITSVIVRGRSGATSSSEGNWVPVATNLQPPERGEAVYTVSYTGPVGLQGQYEWEVIATTASGKTVTSNLIQNLVNPP